VTQSRCCLTAGAVKVRLNGIDAPEKKQPFSTQAQVTHGRDAGRLWDVSLCGPLVPFDQRTGTHATSRPEPDGPVPRFPGFVDGPVSWGGQTWFAVPFHMLPPNDADLRQQLLLHGLFHRIRPELGFLTDDGYNEHLDTLEGRVWIQLEWRALRRAVESSGSDQAEAIADALAFRRECRRRFPSAEDNERRDEIREGLATYTRIAGWASSPALARACRGVGAGRRCGKRIAAAAASGWEFRGRVRTRLRCAAGRSRAGVAPTGSCHLGPWRLARVRNEEATDDGSCRGSGALRWRSITNGRGDAQSGAAGARHRVASTFCRWTGADDACRGERHK
jgi:hypothetical protein